MEKVAILLFGGKGERFDSATPKQFHMLGGHCLCYYATKALEDSPLIDKIIAVSEPGSISKLSNLLYKEYGIKKLKAVIPGGSSRQQSVYKALSYLKSNNEASDSLILIQDGDRPNLSEQLIRENIDTAARFGASVTVIPATDSLLYAEEEETKEYLAREKVYQVQTPQCLRFDWAYKAHQAAIKEGKSYTDDASMLSLLGKKAHLVMGSKSNIKITTPIDAEIFLKEKRNAA